MLLKIFLFASHLYFGLCEVTYELDVQGESQHGYYVTVSIGYPPQNIKLIIDTGSANFAVAITPPLKGRDNFFHYTLSDTFQKLSSNIEIQYVQGNWSGFLATDFVSVSQNHSIRTSIACMTSIHNIFDINSMFTGVLGLAYPALAKPNSSILPLFDTIRKAKTVNNIFSLGLCGPYFSSTDLHTWCGKLHLGFISALHYEDEIIYSPIMKEELYEILLTMIKVGSESVTIHCKELNDPRSLIDTGTTQLLVSKSVYYDIISRIKEHFREKTQFGNITVNINKFWLNDTAACFPKEYFNVSFFPDLTISFYHTDTSSFNLVLSPELYLLPWQQEFSVTCFTLGIGISDFGTIIGSTLLKGYYVIFDRSNKQVGFANSSSLLQNNMKLASFVTLPHFLPNENYSNCKPVRNSDLQSDSISVGTIILLLLVLMLTVLLLYRVILWAIGLRHSDNSSDTSSLVSEAYKLH